MAEVFTRKFIQQNGDPVVGGVFRLVNLTNPLDPPCELYEIVSADPEEKGQYYSSLGNTGTQTALDHGVYRIEKWNGAAWVAFGGPGSAEATIEPGRAGRIDGTGTVLIDKILADEVRVSMFVNDNTRSNSHINEALTWAAANGIGRVYVGAYDGAATWSGSSQITIPDGLTLDLGGASLETSANAPLILFSGSGCVKDGILKAATGQRVATTGEEKVMFQDVDFVRPGFTVPTAAASNNSQTPVLFVGCSNVVVAPAGAGTDEQRLNIWVGCTSVKETTGTTADHTSSANVTATELAKLLKNTTTALGSAPSVTPPFSDNSKFAEAVKQMWFSKVPSLESRVGTLESSSMYAVFEWYGSRGPTNPNGDPSKVAITNVDPTGFSVYQSSVVNLERKAYIYGFGARKRICINVAGTIKFDYTGNSSGDQLAWSAEVDFSDMQSAIASVYSGIPSVFSKVYDSQIAKLANAGVRYRDSAGMSYNAVSFTDDAYKWLNYPLNLVSQDNKLKFYDHISMNTYPNAGSMIIQFYANIDMPLVENLDHSVKDNSAYASPIGLATETK